MRFDSERVEYTSSDPASSGLLPWAAANEAAWQEGVVLDAALVAECKHEGLLGDQALPTALSALQRTAATTALRLSLGSGERVREQYLQVVDVPTLSVTWGLDRDELPLVFLGRRLFAPPPALELRVFRARAQHLTRVLGVGVVLAASLAIAYAARGPWYRSGAAWGVFAAVIVGALAVYFWRRAATTRRPRSRRWLLGVPAALLVGALCVYAGEPDRDHARASIRAGKLADAEAELEALGGEGAAALAPLYVELRRAQIQASTSSLAARRLLEQIPTESPHRSAAEHRVDELLLHEAGDFLAARRVDLVEATFAQLSPSGRQSTAARALDQALGLACTELANWSCAAKRIELIVAADPVAAPARRTRVIAGLSSEVERIVARARDALIATEQLALLTDAEAALQTLEVVQRLPTASARLVALRAQVAETAREVAAQAARVERRRQDEPARAERARAASPQSQPQRSCCKVCTRGCACGDSCISCSKTCRSGPGCAC